MKMSKLAAVIWLLTAGAGNATGDVYCRAVDQSDAEFGYGFGRVPGLAIVSATVRAGGRFWSMQAAEGADPIIVAQGAHDGPDTIIDFADPEFTRIVISVRVISAVQEGEYRSVGLMRIPGVGVFAMSCE